ncbi:MAG: preprotein translocase subunit SecE [Planctomycetes bacterium]|nr:preprotein translocase subunit SecE [Planctomycetota bacterium]
MNKSAEQERGVRQSRQAAPTPTGAAPPRQAGGSALHIYKPGQGLYVRWCSAAAFAIIAIGSANFLYEQLARVQNEWVQFLIPVGLLVLIGYGIFRFLGQSRSVVDFMIATEGEMKKVNWSTRREVLGATKVVIATVIALGVILFAVNICFIFLFESIGVLRIGMLAKLFGGGEAE